MIRNLKILTLAVTAVLVMSATVAEGASAAAFSSNSATGNTNISGVNSITVHPVYTSCTTLGQSAAVTTTGCNYVFTKFAGSTTTGIETEVAIVCGAGNAIVITHESCTKTIRSQNGLKTVLFTNSSPEADLTATFNLAGIVYEEAGPTCTSAGVMANGTYTGTATFQGFEDPGGAAVKYWVE